MSQRRGTSVRPTEEQSPKVVNEAVVRQAMKGAKLKTQQKALSLPVIERYVRMLEQGKEPPAITVDGNVIVEGNHRYLAGRVFGEEPPTIPGRRSPVKEHQPIVDWRDVFLDPVDRGNE